MYMTRVYRKYSFDNTRQQLVTDYSNKHRFNKFIYDKIKVYFTKVKTGNPR